VTADARGAAQACNTVHEAARLAHRLCKHRYQVVAVVVVVAMYAAADELLPQVAVQPECIDSS
jgi:hypothetical protein